MDPMGMRWILDVMAGKPKPTNTEPGLIYMLNGATQHSFTDPFDRTSPAIPIGPHWMILWPFDARVAGLPTVMRDAGTLVMFAGTPYAHDPLGTKASFDATTGDMLKDFYEKWYSPSNMILVIVGDVDAAKTLAEIKQLYSATPKHAVPARPAIDLQPFKTDSFTIDSNLPYVLGFIAYRMPGTDSPDYAAAQILGCIGE